VPSNAVPLSVGWRFVIRAFAGDSGVFPLLTI
jgi:hypothetical protein